MEMFLIFWSAVGFQMMLILKLEWHLLPQTVVGGQYRKVVRVIVWSLAMIALFCVAGSLPLLLLK